MNTKTDNLTIASYFDLQVEVVHKFDAYSWVRLSGRDLIVDTADLDSDQRIRLGPTRSFSPDPIRLFQAKAAAK